MKRIRLLIPAFALVAALLATTGVSFATADMGKKVKKPCATCHTTPGKKDLNEVGKYYKEKQTLEGAPIPPKKKKS